MPIRPSVRLTRLSSLAATLVVAVIAVGPARATDVTFAQYTQTDGAEQQWSVSNSGPTTTISVTGADVQFAFSGVSGLPFAGPEDAILSLSASTMQLGSCAVSCGTGDGFTQLGYSGTFSFIDNGGGVAQGTDLLSGTFAVTGSPATTGAQFGSSVGSSGASFRGSANPGNLLQLVLASDYLDFVGQTQETASFSLSSLIPIFAVGTVTNGQALPSGSFNASGTGTFSSNPGPVPSGTPEPASFGLIGAGLCALAFTIRRRPKHSTAKA